MNLFLIHIIDPYVLKLSYCKQGWNHGSLPFSKMSRDENKRKQFIEKAVEFLIERGFDGLGILSYFSFEKKKQHKLI